MAKLGRRNGRVAANIPDLEAAVLFTILSTVAEAVEDTNGLLKSPKIGPVIVGLDAFTYPGCPGRGV